MSSSTPRASRLRRPSWSDPRLLIGVILIVTGLIAGIVVVRSARSTTSVFAATQNLVAGQQIDAGQLSVVDVNLGHLAGYYRSAEDPLPPGAVTVRDLRSGELVQADAIADATSSTVSPVVVPVDQDGAGVLVAGSVVDVWVNLPTEAQGAPRFGNPRKLLSAIRVARVPEAAAARVSGTRSTIGVQLMVPSDQVEALIAVIDQGGRITAIPVAGSVQRGS